MKKINMLKKQFLVLKKRIKKVSLGEKFSEIRATVDHISLKKKISFLVVMILVVGLFARQAVNASKANKITYETAQAEKGALVKSISGSGTITSGNYTNITTKVSGVVSKVYVTNGDRVTKGQKIAEVSLDDYAIERQTAAWVSYLEATEAVKDAQKAKATADIQMWKDRESLLNAIDDYDDGKGDTVGEKIIVSKQADEAKLAFDSSQLKYLNANSDIANAQAKVSSALRNYQENSSAIFAPATGTISDLALAEGVTVSANSTTSSTSGATIVSGQTVGKINNPDGRLIASITLSEIDIVNVKANQKVTLTLDAYSDKSFTGKVLAVNTSGSVSSGVTSYPVTILLDPVEADIYPNMAVNAEVITNIIANAILVPSSAVTTNNDASTVQVRKNGQITTVSVEVGASNDLQTEIKSGINEGDEVITSTINSASTTQADTTASPFSGFGRTSGSSNNRGTNIRFGPGGF